MKHLVIALAASLFVIAPPAGAQRQPRPVGNMVFDSARGKISMDKYKGKVTVVMFFLTDCSHCVEMTKILMEILAARHGDFTVIGVALDENAKANVPEFVRQNGVSFPVGWVTKDEFFRYTDLPTNTKPFVPILMFIDKDFEVNRQYQQNHRLFSTGAKQNTAGIVNMLIITPAGKAKDLPRLQTGAPNAPAKK